MWYRLASRFPCRSRLKHQTWPATIGRGSSDPSSSGSRPRACSSARRARRHRQPPLVQCPGRCSLPSGYRRSQRSISLRTHRLPLPCTPPTPVSEPTDQSLRTLSCRDGRAHDTRSHETVRCRTANRRPRSLRSSRSRHDGARWHSNEIIDDACSASLRTHVDCDFASLAGQQCS